MASVIDAFIPQIWDGKILLTLRKSLIALQICDKKPQGEIKKKGAVVHFTGMQRPTISKYTGTITYETLKSGDVPLTIDQYDDFAFEVDDIKEAQASVELEDSSASEAAYGLRDTADQYVLGMYGQAGLTAVTDATLDSATVLSSIGLMSQRLDEVNVPNERKWIVIPPWVKLKLQLAGIKFGIKQGIKGATGLQWTDELGFDLYVSNNLASGGAGNTKCLGGSKNCIVYAEQILETEAIRLESKFATGVRGLHVYGAKVVRPNELVVGDFTYAAETAI